LTLDEKVDGSRPYDIGSSMPKNGVVGRGPLSVDPDGADLSPRPPSDVLAADDAVPREEPTPRSTSIADVEPPACG